MHTKLALGLCLALSANVFAQERYRRPPAAVAECIEAPATPAVSFSPARTHFVLTARENMPSIAVMARPVLALAGRRIDPGSRGPQRGSKSTAFTLVTVEGRVARPVEVPAGADLGGPVWSADGKRFAFTNTLDDRIELWVADVEAAKARRIDGVRLSATLSSPVRWMPDQTTLLCTLVPGGGKPPEAEAAPPGPVVEETSGRKAPVRTYADLLKSEHDMALFEHYMTSQLALVEPGSGKVSPLGAPGLVSSADASPDGKLVLVTRIKKPFSYLVGASAFPREVDVVDRAGKLVKRIADLPSSEGVPIEGVLTGPRSVRWDPLADATLLWVEALDGGNPETKVPHRDRLVRLAAPFDQQPAEWQKTEHRFQDLSFGEGGELALLTEYERDRRWVRTWRLSPAEPAKPATLFFERSSQDAYRDQGRPVSRVNARGDALIHVEGGAIFLDGQGAGPEGNRPFLHRLELASGKKDPLFTCDAGVFEQVVGLLAPDGSRLLLQCESLTEPPNFFELDPKSGLRKPLTTFDDPTLRLTKGIEKRLLTYQRADGVKLSATLYLPPGRKEGERLPLFVWAYPREYNEPDVAGQVRGSPFRYTRLSGLSPLLLLLCGYAVLDDASMPVVGSPKEANDTFVAQIVDSARAAIDAVVALGVADPDRVAVGGHSYGAFMTANLLAHCDLFRAGVARSGAYNRTLTPFGFQNERRTLWEAPQIYASMSPFMHAHRINEPLLIIHGEADNNPGTFTIQSQRLYHAIKGNGGTARLVLLPHESHGYRATESVLHTLAETIDWLDRHVKNAGPRAPAGGAPADASGEGQRQRMQERKD